LADVTAASGAARDRGRQSPVIRLRPFSSAPAIVRTALTPAVDSDVAKFLSKLPEELEHYSELLYNQRARPVPRKQ
jgi:hypothetical protein